MKMVHTFVIFLFMAEVQFVMADNSITSGLPTICFSGPIQTNTISIQSPEDRLKYDMDYSERLQNLNYFGASIDAMRAGIRRYAESQKQQTYLVPISYTNKIITEKHERIIEYIYDGINSNMIVGYNAQSTNLPMAMVYSVTYGIGTNAVFVLNTLKTLSDNERFSLFGISKTDGWHGITGTFYNNATWIDPSK